MLTLSQYVVERVFHHYPVEGGTLYWRSVAEPSEGYMVIWTDENNDFVDSMHTYRCPADVWPSREDSV